MDARALSCPTARLCRPFLRRPGARASRQQYRGLACAVDRGPGRVLEADGRAGALSGLCPLEFRGPPADPPSGLRARLERPRRGSTEGRLRAVDALGDEPALSVRRCHARRLEEFSAIQGRDARAVLFRRSLGDAAGGRTAVFGIYLDHAGNPHRHARRRRSEKDRPSRLFPRRAPRHAVARCCGVAAGGVVRPGAIFRFNFQTAKRRGVVAREGGGPSIPETPAIEPRSRGVLDRPPSRAMTSEEDTPPRSRDATRCERRRAGELPAQETLPGSSLEKDPRIEFGRSFVENTLGEEITPTELIEAREPCLRVERLLVDRLENHLVADLADLHFGALEAKFLGQPHGLAAAMREKLGGWAHDPVPSGH